ncbi:MAG: polysaccharide pyruvyl transferase CsaB [Candidatus Margulisiibacteriota bacterium]
MKIALLGYYGFQNLGDEAILGVLLRKLPDYIQGADITVFDNPHYIHERKPRAGVRYVSRKNLFTVFSALLHSEVLIVGGGGILQDVTSRRSLYYYLTVISLAKMLGKKVILLAQGIGPLRGGFGKHWLQSALHGVEGITCRDKASINLLASLGITRVGRHDFVPKLTADLAYLTEPVSLLTLSSLGVKPGHKAIGLIWRFVKGFDYKAALKIVKKLAHSKDPICCVLLPFQPIDKKLYNMVRQHIPVRSVVLRQDVRPGQMLELIQHLDGVIAMRYHGLVFARLAEIPYEGLVYDPKVEAFLKDKRSIKEFKDAAEDNFTILQEILMGW